MAGHARLSPSSAERWTRCAASPNRTAHLPNRHNIYTLEGTLAHGLAARLLLRMPEDAGRAAHDFIGLTPAQVLPPDERQRLLAEITAQDTNLLRTFEAFEVSAEMAEHVANYVWYVETAAHGGKLLVESRLDLRDIVGEECSGTADAIVLSDRALTVIDLKYGKGKRVAVRDNLQTELYALGAVLNLIDPIGAEVDTVRLCIFQPRVDNIDVEEIGIAELRARIDWFRQVAAMTRRDDAPATPGEVQCYWCAAQAVCPERALAVLADVTESPPATVDEFEALPGTLVKPDALAPSQLALILPKLDSIQRWCSEVYAYASSLLLFGGEIPGYKLVAGKRGARRWTDERAVEDLLRNSMRVPSSIAYKSTLISPTQAEKVLKPRQWSRLQQYITQASGAPAVVPESDKRPPLSVGAVDSADFEPLNPEQGT